MTEVLGVVPFLCPTFVARCFYVDATYARIRVGSNIVVTHLSSCRESTLATWASFGSQTQLSNGEAQYRPAIDRYCQLIVKVGWC